MPPHRTKGPGVLDATPEQPIGPFGRWAEADRDQEQDNGIGQDEPQHDA